MISILYWRDIHNIIFFSFAVDSSINVMTPTDASVGEDDIGGDELSAMDIQKLNRGYSCENSNTVDYILV